MLVAPQRRVDARVGRPVDARADRHRRLRRQAARVVPADGPHLRAPASGTTTCSTSPRRSPAAPTRRSSPRTPARSDRTSSSASRGCGRSCMPESTPRVGADPEKAKAFNDAVEAALPIVEKMTRGTATQEEIDTWNFLDQVGVPDRARSHRARPGRDLHHRCRAAARRDPVVVPRDRRATHRGLRHVGDDGRAHVGQRRPSPAASAGRRRPWS